MKCRFKYEIEWEPMVSGVRSFMLEDWHFDFVSEKERLTHILITVPLQPDDKLPEVSRSADTAGEINFNLNLPSCYQNLIKAMRTLEGFLSVYGLRRISLDDTDIVWIPESEDEKKRLVATGLNLKRSKPNASNFVMPFSVVTRSIIESRHSSELEIPLNFYRKGRIDFLDGRYIDAIYDFYFLIETMFGSGKTKNRQIENEFKSCFELNEIVSDVLKNAEEILEGRGVGSSLFHRFQSKYKNNSSQEFLVKIVRLRGFLHHHSLKRTVNWHPSKEVDYEMEAVLLSHICFKICSNRVEGLICSPLRHDPSIRFL